jgi:hypothetical protein
VAVSLANGSKRILVLPSEKAICMPQEKEIKAATAENTASYLLNTEYNMSFERCSYVGCIRKNLNQV